MSVLQINFAELRTELERRLTGAHDELDFTITDINYANKHVFFSIRGKLKAPEAIIAKRDKHFHPIREKRPPSGWPNDQVPDYIAKEPSWKRKT